MTTYHSKRVTAIGGSVRVETIEPITGHVFETADLSPTKARSLARDFRCECSDAACQVDRFAELLLDAAARAEATR